MTEPNKEEMNEMNETQETNDTVKYMVVAPPATAPKYSPNVLTKLNTIRGMTLTMDWTPDKVMKIGMDKTKWYPYLSIDKIKSNLGPAFAKAGLEIVPSYEDIQFKGAIGNMTQHVVLTMVVDVVDIHSGDYVTYRTPGEAGDTGDKVLSKAQTYALKSWLSTIFLLGEGFDPNMTEEECPDGYKGFVKPTPTEATEMKSKVLDGGIKPVAPAPAKPVAAPAKPVKAAEKPAEAETPEKPVKAPAKPAEGKKPSAIQEGAMKKLVEEWTEAAKDGRVDAERYNEMAAARAEVTTQAEAVDFLADFEKVA